MPNNDIHKFESHVSDIENAKKKYNTSDYKVSGWLEVENTNINLPIFRAIHKSFEYPVTMERYGWTLNVDDKYYDFMTVFGHNLMNLGVPKKEDSSFKRFEELMAFSYDDFADSHKYFQYTVDGKEYIYKIFSVSFFDSRTIYKFVRVHSNNFHNYCRLKSSADSRSICSPNEDCIKFGLTVNGKFKGSISCKILLISFANDSIS